MKFRKKIITEDVLAQYLSFYRFKDYKVVFTNGCFDVLHRGHIEYLARAAEFGDVLIVAVNSDNSVRKLKGEGRPVNNEEDRMLLLASLGFVDNVILFDEETPERLIRKIVPDVLVKGGDYTKDKIVGANIVEQKGGKVEIIKYISGYSSTAIIDKQK
ncbi:MAG: D-glycero-beta-D-manno-heptose 1-phosphate adenylyltransferase [Marinilabiliales bacterium]|nr:MAG: D-glycero-beta-D-manno-heptose 1-phosphate adenylyltransferase [Marinilabiliales bacterium]